MSKESLNYSMLEDLLSELVESAPLAKSDNPDDRDKYKFAWNNALNEMFWMHQKVTVVIAKEEKANTECNALKARVTAFAGQLQAWGFDDAAKELLNEVLGEGVNAPDYYALKAERDATITRAEKAEQERDALTEANLKLRVKEAGDAALIKDMKEVIAVVNKIVDERDAALARAEKAEQSQIQMVASIITEKIKAEKAEQECDALNGQLEAIKACGFEIYHHDDGRIGLQGHGVIYLPDRSENNHA